MRVAIFSETFLPKVDGIVVKVCKLLSHLEQRGHESILFAPEGAPESYAGTRIVSFQAKQMPFYPELPIVPPWVRPAKILEEYQPDVVHLVNPTSLGLAGLLAAKRLGIPVLASYHTDMPGFAEHWHLGFLSPTIYAIYREIHNQCDLNVCPSEFTRRQLVEHGFEEVHVWRGGVDIELYSPSKRDPSWRQRLTDGHPDRRLLLYIGRVSVEKRIDRLLPVVKALPDISLAIIGDGPKRKELEELFAGTNTLFTGYLKGEDLARAYAAGDVFVFTGDKETFGNVVVEAMASGLPVVAPNSGGVTDLVMNRVSGLLYEPGNTHELVSAVTTLVNDPELAERFGEAGRSLAEKRTWEVTLDELLGYYESLLADGKQGKRVFAPLVRAEFNHVRDRVARLFSQIPYK